jgi:fucose permease
MGALTLPQSWPVPLFAVAVAGLGFGGLVLIINTVMAAHGVSYVNLVNGTYGLGAAAGPFLISLTHGGWLFAVLAVGVLVSLPLAIRGPESAAVTGRLRPSLVLALFCLLLFSYAGIETGLSSWEALHLRAHGFSADTAAALTSLFWLGLAAGRLLVPIVTREWSPPRIILTALAACAGGLLLITVSVSAPVGFFLLGVFAGPIFPSVLAWIAATLPNPRRVNAFVLTTAMLGNASVPAVIGFGLDATSPLVLPAFVVVPVAGCAAIVLWLRSRTRVRQ